MADDRSIETYRSLRDMIKNATGDESIQSVLVADIDRQAPSSVARHLAEAFRTARDTCVQIDTNFRRPDESDPGLSDLIDDPALIEELLANDDESTIVGPGTVGTPDLLSSSGFPPALQAIVERFDYAVVTCDTYPGSSDLLAVAPSVDAVILVISAGVTGREPAMQARDALDRIDARILGLVVVERPRRWF